MEIMKKLFKKTVRSLFNINSIGEFVMLGLALYFGLYGAYLSLTNPELTQAQVLLKLLGL